MDAAGTAPHAAWLAAVDRAETALQALEAERGALHARLLRQVLELASLHRQVGSDLPVVPHLALLLRCSESRADLLLTQALGLGELPNALDVLDGGLLTVEQGATLVRQLAVLELPDRVRVWQRLHVLLLADAETGVVRPPARLAERLRRWVLQADDDAVTRRQRSRAARSVEYRRRDDGLVDLTLHALEPTTARSVLSRIARLAAPRPCDERTADQRRADAMTDVLLGRVGTCLGDAARCGCLPGAGAPCGADVQVLVPLASALGLGDQPAELTGHGPLDAGQTADLLAAGPVLRPVWTDAAGVPVAVGARGRRVPARDPDGLLRTLLEVAAQPPPPLLHPQRPDDHDRPPGPYRPGADLRRLVDVRAPRCEWAGCGARSAVCDADHDEAWPQGPTCAGNLGPLCRRHHRVKQLLLDLGWTKARGRHAAVTWTSPTGRAWTGPAQRLTDEQLLELGLVPGDPGDPSAPPDVDPDSPRTDLGQHRLLETDTSWDLDLADPAAWLGSRVGARCQR